jgi:hypothetical protein
MAFGAPVAGAGLPERSEFAALVRANSRAALPGCEW